MNKKVSAEWVIALFSVIFVLLFTVTAIAVMQNNTHDIVDTETYVVEDGDTLWDVAKLSNGYNHMDIREIIYDIQQLSDCTSDIQRGDVLLIPIYEGLD